MKIDNVKFKTLREAFTESKDVGINASRKLLADAAGLRSIQRIIDYETSDNCGANVLVIKSLAKCLKCSVADIVVSE